MNKEILEYLSKRKRHHKAVTVARLTQALQEEGVKATRSMVIEFMRSMADKGYGTYDGLRRTLTWNQNAISLCQRLLQENVTTDPATTAMVKTVTGQKPKHRITVLNGKIHVERDNAEIDIPIDIDDKTLQKIMSVFIHV